MKQSAQALLLFLLIFGLPSNSIPKSSRGRLRGRGWIWNGIGMKPEYKQEKQKRLSALLPIKPKNKYFVISSRMGTPNILWRLQHCPSVVQHFKHFPQVLQAFSNIFHKLSRHFPTFSTSFQDFPSIFHPSISQHVR